MARPEGSIRPLEKGRCTRWPVRWYDPVAGEQILSERRAQVNAISSRLGNKRQMADIGTVARTEQLALEATATLTFGSKTAALPS